MTNQRGFTFIEVTVALGVFILMVVILTPVVIGFYLTYQFNSEAQLAVSLLEYARAQAMANKNESNHGIYIGDENYVLFRGDDFASRVVSADQEFPRAANISATGASEIVFEALSGRSIPTTLTLTQDGKDKLVFVNEEGRVEF